MKSSSLPAFCRMVMDRFGQDHVELLIRQLFQIRQSGSVAEYAEQFAALVDQLTPYGTPMDPLYYGMRFIDGLSADNRAPVMLQRPPNWDRRLVSICRGGFALRCQRGLPRRGYLPIPVPMGENFPHPCPRECRWGAFVPHPCPRMGNESPQGSLSRNIITAHRFSYQ
jgi:hypothetical protein